MIKNKLWLIALMVFNVTAKDIEIIPSLPVSPRLQKTIPQKVVKFWKSMNPQTKQLFTEVIATVFISAICYRIQNNLVTPEHFKLVKPGSIKVGLNDIIGADDAKKAIGRFIAFNNNSQAYKDIGAKPVQGVILHGPPGTGKTDFARATAKECGLPFIQMTGSDFNGIYRGSGTEQIRKLEAFANAHAPCIVFIDEIDACMKKPSSSLYSGADEASTTNKWKTLLDGFSKGKKPILFIGATNRLGDIDEAMLRDGRLTQIKFGLPSEKNIVDMFDNKLYCGSIKSEPGIDTKYLATLCYKLGCTGASIAELINKATYIAVERGSPVVTAECLRAAIG